MNTSRAFGPLGRGCPWAPLKGIRRALSAVLLLLAASAVRAGQHIILIDGSNSYGQTFGTVSAPFHFAMTDDTWVPFSTAAAANVTVTFSRAALNWDFSQLVNAAVEVSTDGAVSWQPFASASLLITTGSYVSNDFQIRVATVTGTIALEAVTAGLPTTEFAYQTLTVLGNVSFTGVSIRNSQAGTGAAATSISPDQDGVQDAALIRAQAPAGAGSWQAIIYSTNPGSPITLTNNPVTLYSNGGDISWYGYDNSGHVVPNDLYFVQLQTYGGAIVDNTLSVAVNSGFIKGDVFDSVSLGPPLRGGRVNAFGPGGGGSGDIPGIDSGHFEIWGLKAGQQYGIQATINGYVTYVQNNIPVNTNLGSFGMSRSAKLNILVQRSMGPAGSNPEVWGSLTVNTTDYANAAYGTAHFPAETAVSDNGNYQAMSTFTALDVPPGRNIPVQLYVPQYGTYNQTVTSPAAGQTLDVLFSSGVVVKNPTVSGVVTLSTPTSNGAWVSVQGYKNGASQPAAFGGAYITPALSTAAYQVFGVSSGTWVFRTYAQGFIPSSATVGVAALDISTVNFSISEGGVITGTVTITGSASAPPGQGGSSCSLGQIPVSLNTYSPANFSSAWTQVCVTTGPAPVSVPYKLSGLSDGTYEVSPFLPGFELNPPGRQVVTVSGGMGNLNLNYLRLSGSLRVSIQLPVGSTATAVTYNVGAANGGGFGGFNQQGTFSSSNTFITGMGTGLYQVVVRDGNPGKGLIKTAAVAVVNGSSSTVTVDMRTPTFAASGSVLFNGSLSLPPPFSVTVSSALGLGSAALGQGYTAPVIQVFSFPLPQNFGNSAQPYQEVAAVPVAGQSYATYSVTGLPVGSYLFRVKNDLNPQNCNNGCSGPPPSLPDFGTTNSVVFVSSDVSGVDITLSNGVDVAGNLAASAADSLSREIQVSLRKDDNITVYQTTVSLVSGSGGYRFQHVQDGNYTLEVHENSVNGGPVPRFAAKPARVVVAGATVIQDMALLEAGAIVGTLRDADTNTLITLFNEAQFLPNNFFFYARANPWVPGGQAEMERCNGNCGSFVANVYISSVTGQFAIYRVLPDQVYDVTFSGFQDNGGSAAAQGQKSYAPFSLSGVRVAAGQTLDLGNVDLRQGVTLSGQVTLAGSTATLANVPVISFPAQADGNNRGSLAVQAFTDHLGNYTLRGIDPRRRYYDVVAAPRPDSGDVSNLIQGVKYGQETKRAVDIVSLLATTSPVVNFSLTAANGVLTGQVATVDGGPLLEAFGDNGNAFRDRRANLTLHLVGSVNNSENPLGEIEGKTDSQGLFRIDGLKPGVYQLRSISVGYVTDLRNVVVAAGLNSAGTVTLRRGGTLSGGIRKPDGSYPSTSEVKFIAAVDRDFTEFAFASLDSDANANTVTGYSIQGFKVGPSYSIIAGSEGDDILQLTSGIVFTSTSEAKAQDLVFKPAPPAAFVTQQSSGTVYDLRFFSTQKLRKLTPDDDDLTKIVTCPACAGTIFYASSTIAGARDTVEVFYDAAPSETSFDMHLKFTTVVVDPTDPAGGPFVYDSTFTFFAGVAKSRIVSIANSLGGDCSLEGSAAGGDFPAGTFDVNGSSNIQVGVQSAASASSLGFAGAPPLTARARGLSVGDAARRLGASAYPSAAFYRAAMAAPSVSPFSSFYDVFLPAGVSHTLKKDALITLKYDDTVTDPSTLNVYYFDPGNNVYLLESGQRQVDAVNKTITVAVRHLSTFVILTGNAPVVGTSTFGGREIMVHNVPNPFNLTLKSVVLNDVASPTTLTVEGTVIKYGVPGGKSGTVKIEIFDAAGALVRTITDQAPAGGAYYYSVWDGRNDGGRKVASGVYLGRITLNNGDEKFFKMAVIK